MIRIVTDSTADFLPEDLAALRVRAVPLQVHFGEEHYEDGVDLTAEQFYDMLAEAPKLPTTSQPSPEQFMREFEAARDAGDDVVCITLSSQLSGTYQSAQIAKEEVGYDRVHVFDSLNACLAAQLLVRRAVQRANEGFTVPELLEDLEQARGRVRLLAFVDTLKYLHKGGRLPAAAAIAGGLLGIKPVVGVKDGKVAIAGKARGLPGAYVAIFKQIAHEGGIDENWPVLVGYTGKRQPAEPFMRYVTQNLHMQKPLLRPIGPVIGTHAGPGAAGIAFFAGGEG
ncbi:MAG TPA: DegV family protein [Candidatus Ruthenibacterium merdigallinarum]|nr:DegV family protein [Candidatus Ruthenibacterium merdigallinarum]